MSNIAWTTRTLHEIGYTIRGRLDENGYYVEVEAYEMSASNPVLFRKKNSSTAKDRYIEDLENAERFLSGHVKWDGCSNLCIDECYDGSKMHFCGKSDATKIGVLLGAIYDLAYDLMPNADWEREER